MHKLKILIILSLATLHSCRSNPVSTNSHRIQNPELISSLSEGRSFIDGQIELLFNEYKTLCESKRNDQLKDNFLTLQSELLNLNDLGFKLSGLNYTEQNELVKYTSEKIKANSELKDLAYLGKISCW